MSKTVLFNLLSVGAVVINQLTGTLIPQEYAALAIALINAISRIVKDQR